MLRRSRPVVATTLVLLGTGSCSVSAPRTPETPAPQYDLLATHLSALHDSWRVAGLEERNFRFDDYWGAVLPLLEGNDLFRVEELGNSAEGRAIRLVSFGQGPTPVLLWSQMHGNESTATMSLADVFAFVGSNPDHPLVRTVLDRLSVYVVPMLNPDGAERFQRRNAQGVDINRDARLLSTPEARGLKAVRDRVKPAFAFNLHDQGIGTRVGDTDRGVAIALLAPPYNRARDINPARRAAMEVAGVIRSTLEPLVGGHIARYDDSFNPRAFGDLMTVWGAGTILIESGGWEGDPQKQYLRAANFVALLAALESIALESHSALGIDPYLSLPPNGRRVGDLLLLGGTLAVSGLPTLRADLLVNYDDPLMAMGGEIADIGDLAEGEARDTVSIEGFYVIPAETALDRDGGTQIQPGAPADFVVARDSLGAQPVWVFQGGPPADFPSRH